MNRIFITLVIFVLAGSAAYAQQPVAPPEPEPAAKSTEKPKSLPPLLLTKDQVERLANAELSRELARARLQAAQNVLEKLDAQIDGLIKDFQIELRLDPAKYERELRVLDQQTQKFGFFPKPELTKAEQKTEPKK